MQPRAFSLRKIFGGLFLATMLLVANASAFGATESILWNFGNHPDGNKLTSGLIMDESGNLYGTSSAGGSTGHGTVFKLTAPTSPSGFWTESVLYSFGTGTDGQLPFAPPAMDMEGNLYGTTDDGGTFGVGTVFKLTPPPNGIGAWKESILWNFNNSNGDGYDPVGGVIVDPSGNLYGTTEAGGANGGGTVYQLSPPTNGSGAWAETILLDFGGGAAVGASPQAPLIMDSNGNLYGTASVVFELSPPLVSGGNWTETFIPSSGSSAKLTMDSKGNLYGTNSNGGTFNFGTVFELSPPSTLGGNWTQSILWSFKGKTTDGTNPKAGVLRDADGNLYGTTFTNGVNYPGSIIGARGSLFRLTPPSSIGGNWTESILWTFGNTSTTDGRNPASDLIMDANENIYGTTDNGGAYGGASNGGTAFEISNVAATPTLNISISKINFGKILIGSTSSSKSVKVTNAGPSAATLNIVIIGQNASDFLITSNTCGASLSANTSCIVSLDFTARGKAGTTESATLVFSDNAANDPQTVALNGSPLGGLSVTPLSLAFGTVTVGQTSPSAQTLTITNNHSSSISLQQTFSGAAPNDYQLATGTTCGANLAAKSQCTDFVTFTPSAMGSRPATLSVSDLIDASVAVSATGTGG